VYGRLRCTLLVKYAGQSMIRVFPIEIKDEPFRQ
jgi:hypothetical protein